MKTRVKKLLVANAISMAVQIALLAVLSMSGLDTWLAVGISKGASWGLFGVQLLMGR